MVGQFFRAAESLLETRPIFHQWDATIRGHVFCSLLAPVLMDELRRRLEARRWKLEWDVVRQDLEALAEVEVREGEQWYLLRKETITPKLAAGVILSVAGICLVFLPALIS